MFQYVSGQETCDVAGGDIGDGSYMDELTARDDDDFYLNVADPASCSGVINYFSYCYYSPEAAPSYVFTFALYRESSSVSGVYDTVSSVFVAERTSSDVMTDLGGGSFTCVDVTVNAVPVEAGDMLGACIADPQGVTRKLDIIGRIGSRSSRLLRAGVSGCSPNSVPSSVIPSVTSQSRRLHLYANIGKIHPHDCVLYASMHDNSRTVTFDCKISVGHIYMYVPSMVGQIP